MKLTLEQIVQATKGRVLRQGTSEFDSFSIDSRKITNGALFFALRGAQTDGHLYVADALQRGAAGAVVERDLEVTEPCTLIRVENSLEALHDLAAFVRSVSPARVIGITGSSGKTSTKEFTAALLSQKYDVFKSEGNLNSLTGLPLSLLSLDQQQCAVFEAGMNQPGEMAALGSLLKPNIGILLNVNPVHLGQFPSIEAIADEKSALFAAMPPDAAVIYNADDPLVKERIETLPQRRVSFGFSPEADLRIVHMEMLGVKGTRASFCRKNEYISVEMKLCGVGNLQNVAAAACTASFLQVGWDQIVRAIQNLEPYNQRGILTEMNGIHIYDDSYNSNPRALDLAFQIIDESKGFKRKIAILGDMLELGPEEVAFHARAGEQIASYHFDLLITAGPLSKHLADEAKKAGVREIHVTANSEEAAGKALQLLQPGDLALVKGSRGMKMETVIEHLKLRIADCGLGDEIRNSKFAIRNSQ